MLSNLISFHHGIIDLWTLDSGFMTLEAEPQRSRMCSPRARAEHARERADLVCKGQSLGLTMTLSCLIMFLTVTKRRANPMNVVQ
jgi:hypothetical protein